MENLYTIVEETPELVVIEVAAMTLLERAMHPEIPDNTKYITISKGDTNTLTVVKTNGTTFDFSWGACGHTLISDSLKRLKRNVTRFLSDSYISISKYDIKTSTSFYVYYNSDCKDYQVQFEKDKFLNSGRCITGDTLDEVLDIVRKKFEFEHDYDQTDNQFVPLIKHYKITKVL